MCNSHSLTGTVFPFGFSGYVTTVTDGRSQRFNSGVGVFNWHYLSFSSTPTPQDPTRGVTLKQRR